MKTKPETLESKEAKLADLLTKIPNVVKKNGVKETRPAQG